MLLPLPVATAVNEGAASLPPAGMSVLRPAFKLGLSLYAEDLRFFHRLARSIQAALPASSRSGRILVIMARLAGSGDLEHKHVHSSFPSRSRSRVSSVVCLVGRLTIC